MRAFFWVTSIFAVLGISVSNLFRFWSAASFWEKDLFILGLAAGIVLFVVDLRTWRKGRARRHKTPESVNAYMLTLLKRGGSFAIFANSLSWIRGSPAIQAFLEQQARGGKEIRIFVPRHNDITRALAAEGVRVTTYSALRYEPEARFTLLNPNEPGSSLLAIGKGTFPHFYIEEFADATHSRVISVVRDLLHLVDRIGERDNT